jgi:hypothetical protein
MKVKELYNCNQKRLNRGILQNPQYNLLQWCSICE